MAKDVLKNHPVTRILHYLFMVPFLPALQPLLVNYRGRDLVIYLCGVALVLFLVVYGNQRPLVRIGPDGIRLYLHYRHKPEFHAWKAIRYYNRPKTGKIRIVSSEQQPVSLRMESSDVELLIQRLEAEGIHAREH